MIRILALSLVFLALSGCGAASASNPTEAPPAPETRTPRDGAATVAVLEPSGAPHTPTAISRAETRTSPTASSTPTPAPAPSTRTSPTASSTPTPTPAPSRPDPIFGYPIGIPGRPLGDGFFIRHGHDVENTWYNPGHWHTGEDWYAIEGDTAGARVYAIADGEVVYSDSNYPGRVVIVRHADDLYSMYGHLDPRLAVRAGQRVARGDLIGTVLRRGDKTPNHLHFEIRTFLERREVNGSAPRYGFRCGRNCPPGPGYWPIDAPDLPGDLGWRNPTHVIARRMLPDSAAGEVVVASKPASETLTLWSASPDEPDRLAVSELKLQPGERFPLLGIYAGAEATESTSALSYKLWYRIQAPDGRAGWVQAAVPSRFETGSDGRPSSVYFNLFPAIETRF